MQVFTLLKFWRNSPGETNFTDIDIRIRPPETDNDDDDSFFDLVLTAPNTELKASNNVSTKNKPNTSTNTTTTTNTTTSVHIQSHDSDTIHKKNKKNSSKRDGQATTTKLSHPPHHSDSFSTTRILPIESVSKPQSPISLLRSPPKFRIFMLSFRKSPPTSTTTITSPDCTGLRNIHFVNDSMSAPMRERSKRFSTRYDDVVHQLPLATLLERDNSLRSKFLKEKSAGDSSKDGGVVYKYFKMIKPLYARASKIRIFDTAAAEEKHGSGSRAVFRNLMKSRMSTAAGGGGGPVPVRRDDSVLQQQDGIQSAILHCKRSYSSSSSSSAISQDCAIMLSRSASDSSSMQRGFSQPRRSAEEEKRSSI